MSFLYVSVSTRKGAETGVELSLSGPVYEPAEDSLLLARHAWKPKGRILDVGTGSGIQALVNAKANPGNDVLGVDISPAAVACAARNAKANGIANAHFLQSDLFGNAGGAFDGIIFNPPYLPETQSDSPEETALSGGKTGRELTDRFLKSFPGHLKENGTVLLLQSSINNVEKTNEILGSKGFKSETLGTESFFFEKLFVLEIRR